MYPRERERERERERGNDKNFSYVQKENEEAKKCEEEFCETDTCSVLIAEVKLDLNNFQSFWWF